MASISILFFCRPMVVVRLLLYLNLISLFFPLKNLPLVRLKNINIKIYIVTSAIYRLNAILLQASNNGTNELYSNERILLHTISGSVFHSIFFSITFNFKCFYQSNNNLQYFFASKHCL